MEMHTRASLHAIHGIDTSLRAPFNVRAWLAKLLKRMQEAERCRRDYRLLLAMDDHQLNDIGLTRADVIAAYERRPGRRDRG